MHGTATDPESLRGNIASALDGSEYRDILRRNVNSDINVKDVEVVTINGHSDDNAETQGGVSTSHVSPPLMIVGIVIVVVLPIAIAAKCLRGRPRRCYKRSASSMEADRALGGGDSGGGGDG